MLGNLLSGGGIKAIGDIVDDLYTSDEERNEAKIADPVFKTVGNNDNHILIFPDCLIRFASIKMHK